MGFPEFSSVSRVAPRRTGSRGFAAALVVVPALFQQGARVNAPVPPNGYVGFWYISADGTRVFHAGYQTVVPMNEVHDTPLDGSQATRVLSAPLLLGRSCWEYSSFRLSADEARILYMADQDTDEKRELYIVPTDGSQASTKVSGPLIAAGDVDSDFLLSPDGNRVLYRADAVQDNIRLLYSGPADGSSAPAQLYPYAVQSFQITPDSSRAVFLSGPLYGVPVDGSAPAVMLSNPSVNIFVGQFVITPDGQRAVFEGGHWYTDPLTEEELARGMYSAPLDGSGPVVELVTPIEHTFSLSSPPIIQVTADSAWALYLSTIDHQLFSARTDGSAPSVLLNGGSLAHTVTSFRLNPDGSQVVFVTQGAGGYRMYRVPVDGSASPVALTDPFPGHWIENVHVTASGRVVYVRRSSTSSLSDVQSVRLDGSAPSVRLSDALSTGGGIGNPDLPSSERLWISPDDAWVVYSAYMNASKVTELFCTRIIGGGPVRKISGPMVAGGDAAGLVQFVPGSQRLVYNADQEQDTSTELFTSLYGGSLLGEKPSLPRPLKPASRTLP